MCLFNGMLFSFKNEGHPVLCNDTEESGRNYVNCSKSDAYVWGFQSKLAEAQSGTVEAEAEGGKSGCCTGGAGAEARRAGWTGSGPQRAAGRLWLRVLSAFLKSANRTDPECPQHAREGDGQPRPQQTVCHRPNSVHPKPHTVDRHGTCSTGEADRQAEAPSRALPMTPQVTLRLLVWGPRLKATDQDESKSKHQLCLLFFSEPQSKNLKH